MLAIMKVRELEEKVTFLNDTVNEFRIKLKEERAKVVILKTHINGTIHCANNGNDIGLCPQCKESAIKLTQPPTPTIEKD